MENIVTLFYFKRSDSFYVRSGSLEYPSVITIKNFYAVLLLFAGKKIYSLAIYNPKWVAVPPIIHLMEFIFSMIVLLSKVSSNSNINYDVLPN